jgi:hypothetical protein
LKRSNLKSKIELDDDPASPDETKKPKKAKIPLRERTLALEK